MKNRKDFSFSRFFKSKTKNTQTEFPFISKNQRRKRRGIVVWPSGRKGTYVRAIHGELKNYKNS